MAEQMTLEQVRNVLEYVRSTCFTLEDGSRVFCGDMADAIDAHLNAAKDEAVAWRYRFYGSQEWVYATAGEGLVCGLPLICSQPLYAHPASPDVVRDAERFQFMLDECCSVQRTGNDYWLWWPMTETVQEGSFNSAREAIDAAKAARENKS